MRRKVLLGAVGIVVVLVAAVWWFVLRDTAPPAPDIDRATQVAADAQATTAPATTSEAPATTSEAPATTAPATTSEAPATTASTTTEAPIPGPSGTWTVDTSIGSFSDFTSSYVGFRVEEELARGIGHVEGPGHRRAPDGDDLGSHCSGPVAVEVGDGDGRPLVGEQVGGGPTDARTGTGDQHDMARHRPAQVRQAGTECVIHAPSLALRVVGRPHRTG